ncbi:hypothetical protein FA15DRAFT_756419 [Coprinopsis marcescibilis]|uniref:DUF6593 domain-containing protein n=1 Tax=Coprinopsis marcescibilis TaxID=230819 RepID=A0A5C3KW41_COPMA|nr:hypothetical protein FA15DRAFT_756419 [Coprinopsis marcescibilis]
MKFILDTAWPLRATYFTEQGAPTYRINRDPNADPLERKTPIEKMDPRSGNFFTFAELEVNPPGYSDILRMGNYFQQNADLFFRREPGIGSAGDDHIFMGPDGCQYRWKANAQFCELVLNNGLNTPVATFHSKQFDILSCVMQDPYPAMLEIFPIGEHMIDLIMVTYAYVERIRRAFCDERERRRQRRTANPSLL